MTQIILLTATGFALYFGIRFCLLKRGIRKANEELSAILKHPEENRIMKLPLPLRELEELERVLNQTLEQVRRERIAYERREREFQRQLEDISHDLRTPLTAIQGYLKLMNQENLGSEEKEYLEVIQRRSSNLQHLVNQFYEFSTLLSGNYKMQMHQVDIGRMCREQLLGSYQQLESAGIEVRAQFPDRPVFIWADENALSRIVGNLLQNAVRYAGSCLEITITEIENTEMSDAQEISNLENKNIQSPKTENTNAEKGILLTCANDASNLTEDAVGQLFERFYTGSQARNQGGFGLGLAISRHLAEQMGGSMTVESRNLETDNTQDADMENGIWLVFKTVFKSCG